MPINKPSKNHIRIPFEKHFKRNLFLYTEGKLTASNRRVRTMKWVTDAWSRIKLTKEMIHRSYPTCSISIKLDEGENDLINICGMEGYALPKFESEFHIESRDYENGDREDSQKSGCK